MKLTEEQKAIAQGVINSMFNDGLVVQGRTFEFAERFLAALTEKQEPVHQFRKDGCIDWYDGQPDHLDGGGPYLTRALFHAPVVSPDVEMLELCIIRWKGLYERERNLYDKLSNESQSLKAELGAATIEIDGLTDKLEAARKDSARWSMIEMLMFLGNVELYQDDSGGYSIDLDPVENIVAQRWTGNSPEEAIDSVIGQIKPVCQTCKGRGVIGGFVSIEAGYQDDPCPECSATVIDAPEASELKKGGA